jgi:outer membrane receptor protein involved in Fe transport
MRLSDSKALPIAIPGTVSADFRAGVLIWTSKFGYRVIDQTKLKIDANAGVRYWHLGEKLNFNPSLLGLNFTRSQSWADPLVGGRVQYLLSPKVEVTALGDVGGFGAGSQQDYQVAGLLGYKLNPRFTLQGGYRYLFVDYRGDNNSVLNLVMSGVLFGVTIDLKPRKGE